MLFCPVCRGVLDYVGIEDGGVEDTAELLKCSLCNQLWQADDISTLNMADKHLVEDALYGESEVFFEDED